LTAWARLSITVSRFAIPPALSDRGQIVALPLFFWNSRTVALVGRQPGADVSCGPSGFAAGAQNQHQKKKKERRMLPREINWPPDDPFDHSNGPIHRHFATWHRGMWSCCWWFPLLCPLLLATTLGNFIGGRARSDRRPDAGHGRPGGSALSRPELQKKTLARNLGIADLL